MSEMSNHEMKAEIARLTKALSVETTKLSNLEESAKLAAATSHYFTSTGEEQPTGRTVTVSVCLNPTVRDEKKLKFKDVEMPTFFYRIALPAGATGSNGSCLSTNGVEYHHGQTYEFDESTLAEIKSRVARCWDHEKSIHGDNENAYRKMSNKRLITPLAAQSRSSMGLSIN